jgi:uncharacterized membrane protein SpoIIM required for sporulation
MARSGRPADAPRRAAFFFFLLSSSWLSSLFIGSMKNTTQKHSFSQIPTDLANKTSPFCYY